MRTYDEIAADAREGRAFSNSTSYEIWASRQGCYTCRNDDFETETWCPILTVALSTGKTPAEWVELDPDAIQDYTCTEYDERRDDDGDENPDTDPTPPPVTEGQIDMFEVFADRIADEASQVRAAAVTQ